MKKKNKGFRKEKGKFILYKQSEVELEILILMRDRFLKIACMPDPWRYSKSL